MGTALTLIEIVLVLGVWAVLRARRRAEALMAELGEALALAAEAQRAYWRGERRYAGELGELVRLRPKLAPFVDGSRHGRRSEWRLSADENGSSFELAVMAVPAARVRGGGRLFKHLMLCHGERGTVSYDTFGQDRRFLRRPALTHP